MQNAGKVETDKNGDKITSMGFNLSDATIEEKQAYIKSLFKKMNEKLIGM